MCQQASDEFVGSDAFSVCVEICFDAMAKYRRGDGADVFDADVHTPLNDCPCFGTQYKILTGSGPGTPERESLDEIRGVGGVGPARTR